MKIKEFFLAIFFIIILLIIYSIFPVANSFQQLIVMATFFLIIPIIFNKFILKRGLGNMGLNIGNWKKGLIWSGFSFVVAGILFFVVIYFFSFLKHYTIPTNIIHDYKNFLFYEFILIIPVIFIYDFFFRGFIMLTLGVKIYYWAIIAQMLLFLVLIIATKSFTWELVPYLINAPLAGVIVYKSRSIFYATGFQFITILILDASIVRLIR